MTELPPLEVPQPLPLALPELLLRLPSRLWRLRPAFWKQRMLLRLLSGLLVS
jgi:hypothetical protein